MTVDILSKDGSKSGTIELPDDIFGIEPNVAVMHQAVKMYLANQRQGTHKVKERNEVRGGGRKPWRQKGRGTARAGTTRSPLWIGGGTVHGPRPRDYRQQMPKKMRQLARRSAFALKAQSNELVIVDDLRFDAIRTKPFADMLKAIEVAGRKALILIAESNEAVVKSGRNIAACEIREVRNASTYDLLNNQVLVMERSSLEALIEQFANSGNGRRAVSGEVDSPAAAESATIDEVAGNGGQSGGGEEA